MLFSSKFKRRTLLFTLGTASALLFSCEKKPEEPRSTFPKSSRLQIFAANQPLAYFADRIGGTEVDVHLPMPKDIDPAFWHPTDDDIAQFQHADLIVMNGAAYSKWAEKVTLPESKIVDTSATFANRLIEVKNVVSHSHGKAGEHSHSGTAFTTWLDFNQAIAQADAIREALTKLKPDQVELFALNFDVLHKELMEFDVRMLAVGKKLGDTPLVASHPIYQYWARRYQLNVQSLLWEPEQETSVEQLQDLKNLLATHPAKWMLWEGDPAQDSVDKLKTLGVESVVFDPCANVPDAGTWRSVMDSNVQAMEKMADLDVK